MILADKIIKARRENGWSQDDLAEQLDVSRQAVSKWEGGKTIPDLDKIIKLSALFGVTTDYLLMDELEETGPGRSGCEDEEAGRFVSLEEANAYMDLTEGSSSKMGIIVGMFVFSPVGLIVLLGLAVQGFLPENVAAGVGVALMLAIIAAGVGVLISMGLELKRFEYIKSEPISIEYGVKGVVEKRMADFEPVYRTRVAIGVVLCIAAAIPLYLTSFFENEMLTLLCVALLLTLVACAVALFVRYGTVNECYKAMLQQDEFTRETKEIEKRIAYLPGIYWCTATAIYLAISFITGGWKTSWILWPVAGVLFAAIRGITVMVMKSRSER